MSKPSIKLNGETVEARRLAGFATPDSARHLGLGDGRLAERVCRVGGQLGPPCHRGQHCILGHRVNCRGGADGGPVAGHASGHSGARRK